MKNIQLSWLSIFILSVILFTAMENVSAQPKMAILTKDGTWCLFSDPRAIYLQDIDDFIMTGFVTEDGSIASLLFNLKTGLIQQSVIRKNLEVDDHDNPAFLRRPNGQLLAFYTKHHNTNLYMNKAELKNGFMMWSDADSINPNGKDDLAKYGDDKYTYANPCMLSTENNRIYLFGRWIGFKPNMTWSDDGGKTWAGSRVIIGGKTYKWEQRPYVKYFCDGKDKIHLVFTDGHPRDEETNSVYYACYSHGAFYRADGVKICTVDQLPFEPKEATLVYDAKNTKERAWVYDISADSSGYPAIAYVRYPSEKEHIYHYTWFDGKSWTDQEMCNSGKWFPQTPKGETEREPHYSGGMSIDPQHPHTLYVSKEENSVFEIEKWVYQSAGKKWMVSPITKNSTSDQVRPFVVRNVPVETGTIVLWNSVEKYIHYTNFRTWVKLAIEK
jgi:hypothetical protein